MAKALTRKVLLHLFSASVTFGITKDPLSQEGIKRALNPPHDNTVNTLHGEKVPDPFRPLEKLGTPQSKAWIERQNKRFETYLQGAAPFKAETLTFYEHATNKGLRESMPVTTTGDGKFLVWREQEGEERESLYIKDVPDYGAPARLLLDPKKVAPDSKTDIGTVSLNGNILLYTLTNTGDTKALRFLDITTGKILPLAYDNILGFDQWDADGNGFTYYALPDKNKTNALLHHKMGTPAAQDTIFYKPSTRETRIGLYRPWKDARAENGAYEFITENRAQESKNALLARRLGSNEKFREILPAGIASIYPVQEIGGKIYAVTTHNAPNEKLVRFDINDPRPEKWETVIAENTADPMRSVDFWQNKIFVTYGHDTGEQIKVFDLAAKYLHDVPLPLLSNVSEASLGHEKKEKLMSIRNFQESSAVYKYNAETNTLTLFRASMVPVNLKDAIVERIYAVSKDGTRVPMTVIRHPDTQLDGTAAVRLYGYGGFNHALAPEFDKAIVQWIRAGGIYVQANLRGGGEYGQNWYDAGRGANKQNVFDDFIACAEHLISKQYTTPKRLAIHGASNGGLLTLATVLQRPDLFGAVISDVPVTDMFRFHIGSRHGYGWKIDYGDPDVKKDFDVAAKYSPLHNVPQGFKHPPILIETALDDDRVLPWHSYKMAATLQAREDKDSITLLHVIKSGGHGLSSSVKEARLHSSKINAFLRAMLGPIDQKAYKALIAQKQKTLKFKNR